ncbi:MAG: SpoIID/LytB domain-containing protein [Synechococcaceae cyanobacterium]|nr:SpoIID/LytB domain-containing protein [Synechococcaceae cyanobacterium]
MARNLARQAEALRRRIGGIGSLAWPALRGLIRAGRHHPVVLTAPVAALAVGVGFAAQALLTPSPQAADRHLLEALIAEPSAASPSAAAAPGPVAPASTTAPAGAAAAATGGLQSQRASGVRRGDALAVPAAGPALDLEIRVALLKLSTWPSLTASGPWRLRDRDGRVLQQGAAGQPLDLSGALASAPEIWLETGPGQHLVADGRPYEGRFRLLRGDGGLRVVNHLPLENYISSVVGGEMPSHWSMEALRAQAVAARSYAMAHMARPADEHWHLGDTTRWQNYTGLAAVNGRTREATVSTAGVILSYQGGIVESLYAATQQIVDEAHGHLGASMSQTGAQELAVQGLRFNEILGRYYRGASLARLQAGAG